MADRANRVSKPVLALAVLGIVGILVAVWAAYALIRPHGVRTDRSLQESGSLGRFGLDDGAAAGIYHPAEENEPYLESQVPSSTTATSSAGSSGTVAPASATTSSTPGALSTPGTTGGGTGPGGRPGPDAAEYLKGRVTGTVGHEVWGTAVRGAGVGVTPGTSGVTDSGGHYAVATAPQLAGTRVAYTLSIDANGSGLRSHGPLRRTLVLGAGDFAAADFAVYYAYESSGTDWRDAEWWSGWRGAYSTSRMTALVAKVRAAGDEFSGLAPAEIDSVLSPRRGASARTKARAEYLALWLDLASARVGFDAPTKPWSVRGWGSGNSGTALFFARRMDSVFASGGDVNWSDVRRLCSGDVLAD